MKLAELSEGEVIAMFTAGASRPWPEVLVANGDDAAAWRSRPGMAQVATTDGIVEGVHFEMSTSPPLYVGRKLMAVNLSDLAAMGAEPRYALVAACLPADVDDAVVREIARGIREMCFEHRVHLIGGNVTRSPRGIVLHATLLGEVTENRIMRRRGAYAGDKLLVSGTLGDARVGLRAPELRDALINPFPRVDLGLALNASALVRAACDVSDGLARDAVRLVEMDGLGVEIDPAKLPISEKMREIARQMGLDPIDEALIGGEDYQLLVAVAPEDVAAVMAIEPMTEIGVVTAQKGVRVTDGRAIGAGFAHFGPTS